MKNTVTAIIALALLLIAGLGCSKLSIPGRVNLLEGDGAVKAVAAVKDKVGAATVNVIRISIRSEEMEVTIQPEGHRQIHVQKWCGERAGACSDNEL